MPEFQLAQNERLKSRKIIGQLFKSGNSFGVYPLRAVWMEVEQSPGNSLLQMGLSVAKKKFPKAVDRNRIRRQVREAYRLNKHLLGWENQPPSGSFAMMILYTGVEALPYSTIEEAMIRLLKRLKKNISSLSA